jgi:hypothetical protein
MRFGCLSLLAHGLTLHRTHSLTHPLTIVDMCRVQWVLLVLSRNLTHSLTHQMFRVQWVLLVLALDGREEEDLGNVRLLRVAPVQSSPRDRPC